MAFMRSCFQVYAIEGSRIAEQAKRVVASNGMEERIIVIHGKVEVHAYYIIFAVFR